MTSGLVQKSAQNRPGTRVFEVIDVQSVQVDQPLLGVKRFPLSAKPKVSECEIFIAGGGMGGLAAALAACRSGAKVYLSEETDWLGGQMTAQGVSALDENKYVEESGANKTYQDFRRAIRAHYKGLDGASKTTQENDRLNPGNCWVSWLSFEPEVALAQIDALIKPYIESGRLKTFLRTKVVEVKCAQGRVRSLLTVNLDTGVFQEFRPRFCLDATELGDLLPLAGVPYSSGAESRAETGERHAPEKANQDNVQDFVYPFVIDFRGGETHVIPKPAHYEQFEKAGKFSFIGYKMFTNAKGTNSEGKACEFLPFWEYRRLIAKENFPDAYPYDVAMINWESNDLRGENIIDEAPSTMAERLSLAKKLSLGFLHWMQTEVPRDDGGKGYPELALRTDVLGTRDGLSKYPYIRESRRIKARRIVYEQDISSAENPGARARLFSDSVGIGLYPIDIHGHQDVPGAGQASKPFQIPLAALVQEDVRNLIPACKNIGTTHVTNGAYRLHPVEWAIGEAAGTLAVHCLRNRTTPPRMIENKRKIRQIQLDLINHGAPVYWFSDVPTDHPDFASIQLAAICGLMPGNGNDLLFRPSEKISAHESSAIISKLSPKSSSSPPENATRAEFARWLAKFLKTPKQLG